MSIKRFFTIVLISSVLFCSCAGNSNKIDPEISQRVSEIYSVALSNPDSEALFINYCTEDFFTALNKSDELSAKNEELVIDYNLWLNAQDWDSPSMSVVSAEILSDETAEAIVNINDFGEESPVKLILSKVGSSWKIADFQYNYDDRWVSTLKIMKGYIKDNEQE